MPKKSLEVAIFGDSHVGKTTFAYRLGHPNAKIIPVFSQSEQPIFSMDVKVKLKMQEYKVNIFDFPCGMALNRHFLSSYLYNVDGIILIYDVTNASSLLMALDLRKEVDALGRPNLPVMLVANKKDIASKDVTGSVGKEYAKTNGCLFSQLSAFDGLAVRQAFKSLFVKICTTTNLLHC